MLPASATVIGAGPLPFSPPGSPLTVFPSEGLTAQQLQLSGACDWYKLSKLVHAENNLISQLAKFKLQDDQWRLENMRDDLLAHRIANSPFMSAKAFLRNNCANDAFIAKWRHDIDKYAHDLHNSLIHKKVPVTRAIELQYMADLLKQQAKASLPYTGYLNSVPKVPSIPPGTQSELPYVPQYTLDSVAESGVGLLPVMASFRPWESFI